MGPQRRSPEPLLTGLCVGLLLSWTNLAQSTDLSGRVLPQEQELTVTCDA